MNMKLHIVPDFFPQKIFLLLNVNKEIYFEVTSSVRVSSRFSCKSVNFARKHAIISSLFIPTCSQSGAQGFQIIKL